jgi:predicted ribosome quality control (RQC) complex YloA/Tae2 family protein
VVGPGLPYVHPLGATAVAYPSILAAIEATAGAVVPEALEERKDRALLQLESGLQRARRRAEQLEAELAGADRDAVDLRRKADLLLAQLWRIERGATVVELDDFEGGTMTVELDPARDPAGNATALYERARRRDRAATRLPPMITRARAEAERLEATIADVATGRVAPDAWLPGDGGRAEGRSGRRPAREKRALPYRTFVTSGGLEVRVGRSGRANDDLTLHHSRPTDIWMHARDNAGAHVVLRWTSTDTNPPHADLVEAATLAALHSRARTSGVVPVDWTRRKYVRKPRRSPPGRVTIERAKTVFVEPSEALAERLRQDRD